MRFRNPWSTEAEIAALTRESLESLGWEVHPECGGWDLLAVATKEVEVPWYGDLRVGDVLGVECKLDAGTVAGLESLLRQTLWMPIQDCQVAIPWRAPGDPEPDPPVIDFLRPRSGPHFRAIVAARIAGGETWRGMGVLAIEAAAKTWNREGWEPIPTGWRRRTVDEIAERLSAGWGCNNLPRRQPQRTPKVPKVVVDVPAGVPSPQTSSPWKVSAVEVMLKLRAGELMTSKQIREMGIDHRRLRQMDWIEDSGERDGRAYLWRAADPGQCDPPPPDLQWPEIATALRKKQEAA